MKNYALILAAGEGRRFGGQKQFFPLRGKPLFLYSVIAFNRSPSCDEIIIVTSKNKVGFVSKKVAGFKKVKKVITGGERRMDSTNLGLREIPNEGIVAVHDAVRPLVKREMIEQGFKLAKKYRAVIFGLLVEETIKRVEAGKVLETIGREDLYRIQTPEFFDVAILRQALQNAYSAGLFANDEAELVERLGYPCFLFLGDKENIKVTTKEDILLVSHLMKSK